MTHTAEQQFLDQYREFDANGAVASPDWVCALRSNAIRRFEENGFPTMRDEAWRFTSLKPITEKEYTLAIGDSSTSEAVETKFLDPTGFRVAIVNGMFAEEHCHLGGLPEGVTVISLASAAQSNADVVSAYLGKQAQVEKSCFSALSTAFLRDGVFVHLARGVELSKPLEILFAGVGKGVVEHPRVLIVAEDNSRLQIVENYVGTDGVCYLRNCVTEVVVGDGASVEMCRLQRESKAAYHTATTHIRQGRASKFNVTMVVLGSALSRHDLTCVLDGEGAESSIRGLSILDGKQHVDHHTLIDHAKPNCQSKEYLNGVLDDESRSVFTGRIVVREGAQKTDSKQSNNNVLLSKSARADSQPQLEIYADDVRCTHGVTLGPLNEDAVLYLRTRGILEADARRMLTYGFGVEIIEGIGIDDVREKLGVMIRQRLLVEE